MVRCPTIQNDCANLERESEIALVSAGFHSLFLLRCMRGGVSDEARPIEPARAVNSDEMFWKWSRLADFRRI
jgi:hypothetical protein